MAVGIPTSNLLYLNVVAAELRFSDVGITVLESKLICASKNVDGRVSIDCALLVFSFLHESHAFFS